MLDIFSTRYNLRNNGKKYRFQARGMSIGLLLPLPYEKVSAFLSRIILYIVNLGCVLSL
jgi:hypothetical protein